MESESKVQWVYSSENNDELGERYDEWAAEYDVDLEEDFAWEAPQRAVEYVAKHVPTLASVLDAGAGTGLVGELLSKRGYKILTAMDLSQGMLDVAAKKGVYQELRQMAMGEPLDLPTDGYDAVVCVGVLTVGHAPAHSLDELVRVTKPGGHIVFSMRPDVYENDGFKEKQSALEAAKAWELVEVSDSFFGLSKGEPDVLMQIWVYRVTT